jgi:pimeloyl-ACP methyl ester carboxylesterase
MPSIHTTHPNLARRGLLLGGLTAAASLSGCGGNAEASTVAEIPGFAPLTAAVNGTQIYCERAGTGPAVVLVHGYTQTGRSMRPLAAELARTRTVIVPDLRGAGHSDAPAAGYDKKNMARDIRELVHSLGLSQVDVVGHDIGLMVGYAYAAQWPAEVRRLVVMDAPLPGIGPNWEKVWATPALWHFHFHGPTAEALVAGRERIYLDHFWNDFSTTPGAVAEADRVAYTAAYARPGRMRAGWEYFKAFAQDAADNLALSRTKLTMPVLTMSGEHAGGPLLQSQFSLVANNVQSAVLPGTGHWLLEEKPAATIAAISNFLSA